MITHGDTVHLFLNHSQDIFKNITAYVQYSLNYTVHGQNTARDVASVRAFVLASLLL